MLDTQSLRGLGPFFAVTTHAVAPAPPWRPLAELVTDPAALDDRIEQVRRGLAATAGGPVGEIELRTATSVAHLGLVARLAAPLLGAAVLGADVPSDLGELYWQPELGGPFPLSLPDPVRAPSATGTAGVVAAVDGPLGALTTAVASRGTLSSHVLWGNVASAVHTAGQLARAARPDLARTIDAALAAALGHPMLRDEHHDADGRFRRRSCCLIYRVAPGPARSVCGDCPLGAGQL